MKDLLKLLKAEPDKNEKLFKNRFLIKIKGAERTRLSINDNFNFIIIYEPMEMAIYFDRYKITQPDEITLMRNDAVAAVIRV